MHRILHSLTLIVITLILMLTLLTPTIAKAHPNTLPTDPHFKGIYEFSSHNSSADATYPAIAGTYLGYYWSQLEPQRGQYNWLGATYIMVFASDIDTSDNQAVLQEVAAQANT